MQPVGNSVMCVAITQLIFERAAAILYHMHYFLFEKSSSTLKILAFSIEKPNKISKSARLTGWDTFINSLATRIWLEVGLTPFLFKKFSMSILFIFYDLSQNIIKHKDKRFSSQLKIILKMYLIDKDEVTM